jgi:hypothetical protein
MLLGQIMRPPGTRLRCHANLGYVFSQFCTYATGSALSCVASNSLMEDEAACLLKQRCLGVGDVLPENDELFLTRKMRPQGDTNDVWHRLPH